MLSPSLRLEELACEAIEVVKSAGRHKKSLWGDNFYANKLVTLRADATNTFRSLESGSPGGTSAIAELIESIFSDSTPKLRRSEAFKELRYNLRTIWNSAPTPREDEGLFPLALLSQAKRGYLVTVGRQMNGCFTSGWHDAAAVMMRRLLEICIIEAFEGKGIATKIRDAQNNYFQLTDLISTALAEPMWALSRGARKALPLLRALGHQSAHGRYYTAQTRDIEEVRAGFRIVIEEFLRHSGLL